MVEKASSRGLSRNHGETSFFFVEPQEEMMETLLCVDAGLLIFFRGDGLGTRAAAHAADDRPDDRSRRPSKNEVRPSVGHPFSAPRASFRHRGKRIAEKEDHRHHTMAAASSAPAAEGDSRAATAAADDDQQQQQQQQQRQYTVLALYQFVNPLMEAKCVERLKGEIEIHLRQHAARGNILLATEGVNGTICYSTSASSTKKREKEGGGGGGGEPSTTANGKDAVLSFLLDRFPGLRTRLSRSAAPVFRRLKVRVKAEIVTMGKVAMSSVEAEAEQQQEEELEGRSDVLHPARRGRYVPPGKAWDELVRDPDCLVIDTRNDYEVAVGTFEGAVSPNTASFVEFPVWLERKLLELEQHDESPEEVSKKEKSRPPSKVAMFCTGGIRCEKATSYCLDLLQKHEELNDVAVYHLEGGILAYLDQVPQEQSTFAGECYVFDSRTAVTHGLKASSTYTSCHACRHPLTPADRERSTYQEGVSCPYCVCDENRSIRRQRYVDRQKQIELSCQKGTPHMHDAKEFPDKSHSS
jgi:UPF0176 protein